MSIHVVLVHPEIHWNTGNTGRTCLAAGATLHLIEPLGFSLGDRQLKRAGLDYWEFVDLRVWPAWESFEAALPTLGEPYFFSTKATRLLWDAPLGVAADIVMVFGRETGGLPDELHHRYADRFLRMPMLSPRVRSLNLSTGVGIAVYEVLRQRRHGQRTTESADS
jgi:tRNA (cytidine/uridine-2'-O-)-methyltransferase